MQKKSFTLMEILISITLFVVIILFLYESLNINEKSNQFFHKKLVEKVEKVEIKKIFFKDIINSISLKNSIVTNIDKEVIFSLYSSNSYHNAFYKNITYFISKENNLLRIESLKKFNKNKMDETFFRKSYIDTIAFDVKKFKVIKKDKHQYIIYLKFKDESDMMFTFKSMR